MPCLVYVTERNVFLWQSEGTLLATGSYDGFARIWTKDGKWSIFPFICCDPSHKAWSNFNVILFE